jgi:predicted HicB family RNase H-like nuclease
VRAEATRLYLEALEPPRGFPVPKKERIKPARAVKGTIDSGMMLRLPADLRKRLKAAAAAEGLSAAEWVRRAIEAILPPQGG